MILTEYPYHGNARLIRTHTDNPDKVLQQVETGRVYDEAIDTYPCRFTYREVEKTDEENV